MDRQHFPGYAGRRASGVGFGVELRCGFGLGLALSLAACAGGAAPHSLPAGDVPAWRLPAGAYGSQRLYRASYQGPQGEGSFRLTLRLVSPERYQVTSADPVGRSLWSLDVNSGEGGERGLWIDHRNRVYCEFEGRFDVVGVPLAPFPLLSLPALLLGRLPAEPAGEPTVKGRSVSYADAQGRRWTALVGEDGLLASWALSDPQAANPGPAVYWVRSESWAILSDRAQQVQVRWREVLREALEGEPPPLAPPPNYRLVDCREPGAPGAAEPN